MPSDLELVERVKRRFLAHQDRASRHLIPFDILKVSELAREITEEALDYLEHRIDPGSTLGSSVRPNANVPEGERERLTKLDLVLHAFQPPFKLKSTPSIV